VPLIIRALHPQVLAHGRCLGRGVAVYCCSCQGQTIYMRAELDLLSVAAQPRGRQLHASELQYGAHFVCTS
jgi:hypothetical protein